MSEVIVIHGNFAKDEPVIKRVSAYARVTTTATSGHIFIFCCSVCFHYLPLKLSYIFVD